MLAEEGKAKAVAFDEIDKAPEEKKRGITIATVRIFCILHTNLVILSFYFHDILWVVCPQFDFVYLFIYFCRHT